MAVILRPARPPRASRFALICAGSRAGPQPLADDAHPVSRRRAYALPEAMTWCEDTARLRVCRPGTKPLARKVDETADAVRTERADLDVVRGFGETRYRAGSWGKGRRAVARIEATRLSLDIQAAWPTLERFNWTAAVRS